MTLLRGMHRNYCKEGKSALNLNDFREVLLNLTPGYLFTLGRSAASTITYVRAVGSSENTWNKGETAKSNWCCVCVTPWALSLTAPLIAYPQIIYGTFLALMLWRNWHYYEPLSKSPHMRNVHKTVQPTCFDIFLPTFLVSFQIRCSIRTHMQSAPTWHVGTYHPGWHNSSLEHHLV